MSLENQIVVQLGDGEGRLSQPKYFSAGANPVDLDFGDFNGDGELDIVTANNSAGEISLLVGDGRGNFTLNSSFSTGGEPQLLTTGKFNQDDLLDIAVANSGNITVLFGVRSGSFRQSDQTPVPYSPRGIRQGDFDRDGKQDLVVYSFSGDARSLKILKGNGDGTFTDRVTLSNAETHGIAVNDFNGDGFIDVAFCDYRESNVVTHLGDGNGNFGTAVISPVGYFFSITSADFNGDGKLDLSTGDGTILLGDGAGRFTFYSASGINGGSGIPAVGDFNSDEHPDLVVLAATHANGIADSTALMINEGNGKFRVGSPLVNAGSRLYGLEKADFNRDGKLDLATINAANNGYNIFLQDEMGVFRSNSPTGYDIPLGGYNVGSYSLTTGDFNEDGITDIAIPDSYASKVAILIGSGTGTFTVSYLDRPANAFNPSFIETADFNNDGHQDLVTLNRANRNFSIYLGNGAGNFTPLEGEIFSAQTTFNVLTVGDFNNDGKTDLILSSIYDPNLPVYLGRGDGTFVKFSTPVVSSPNAIALKSFDFNSDNNSDLAIIAAYDPSVLHIKLGNGNGTFRDLASYPINSAASADILIEDFDLDGSKDIIVGDIYKGALFFFKGDGTGAFSQSSPIVTGPSPYSLVSGDFNNDGKPDIATASHVYAGAKVLLNDTNILTSLSVNDVSVAEGSSGIVNAAFTVSLSSPANQAVSVNYKMINRTAEKTSDYVPVIGQITFPAGSTSQTIIVQVKGDVLDETDETFVVSLSNPINAAISDAVGVGTIIDDDLAPNLSVQNASVTEGNEGNVEVSIPVNLSAVSGKKVKVQYATGDGTATSPSDYSQASGIFFLSPGEASKNLKISVTPDTLVEADESFKVNFSNPVDAALTNNQSTATIFNDDVGGNVQFSSAVYNVVENAGTATITVTRANGAASGIIVQYATTNGTAVAAQDYTAVSGSVTFGANETSKTFTVPVINDSLDEDQSETVNLSILNVQGGATLGNPSGAILNIEDDDPTPSISINDISVREGNQGAVGVNFNVSLTNGSAREIKVNFAANDGTAVSPTDYTATSGTLTFAPGETNKSVTVQVVGDTAVEPNETFTVNLSNPVNASIASGTGTGTILNDDSTHNRKTAGVFRPSNGITYMRNSNTGGFADISMVYGVAGDTSFAGDWNGDRVDSIGIYRNGVFYLRNSNTTGPADVVFAFGSPGDQPIAGDWNGDGIDTVGIYRPTTGVFMLRNSNSAGAPDVIFVLGNPGDVAIAGDWNGDGITTTGVFRPTNGIVYLKNTNATGNADIYLVYGVAGDKPVAGDWDADGIDSIGIYRNGVFYLRNSNTQGVADIVFALGNPGDEPIAGDWDGLP